MREGPIVKKSLEFSISIVKYCDLLYSKKRFVVSNQLLKSATSIGANVFDAQHSESRMDFIHKMKIALKEANETFYWLAICERMEDLHVIKELLIFLNELISILSKIVITAKKNLKNE
jgi:four helix bundle protein